MSQLLPLIVLALAWFFLQWLDRRRAVAPQGEAEIRWQKTKRLMKMFAVGALLLWGMHSYSEWSDARQAAKVRAAMTPEQRAAVDAETSRRNAEQAKESARVAKEAAREAKKQLYRDACMRRLLDTLHDPAAAELTWSSSALDNAGAFSGFIEGRAKNGFGALVKASWYCEAVDQGNSLASVTVRQLSN